MVKALRLGAAVALVAASGVLGALIHAAQTPPQAPPVSIPETTIVEPSGTTRVIYNLDQKKNDQELVALINAATSRVYFAIYTFTLGDVADALVAAKARGVEVRGLVDRGQSEQSFEKPLIEKLRVAGIPLMTEDHHGRGGIMHIKLLVTDRAYALGSYNWTASATTKNDEILEIGTDPTLRATYEKILAKLFATYDVKG